MTDIKAVAGEEWEHWLSIDRHPGNSVTIQTAEAVFAKLAAAVEKRDIMLDIAAGKVISQASSLGHAQEPGKTWRELVDDYIAMTLPRLAAERADRDRKESDE